ncbi:MAG: GNAT family N-acetyltransferase [Verrucomicrobiales bacterium]|nr:GNAT family N-acetyltransferase [Verrucomicrobiales bacterium]
MKIVENDRKLLKDFIRLNEEWISTHFELEEADRKLAENPGGVIDRGGYIFSLVSEGEVLGVCALFHEGDGVFELARMAVSPRHQGQGCGHLLMNAAIEKLGKIKAKKVYLISNTKLQAALALYRKHGFLATFEGPHPVYSRANIVMERKIT